MTQKKPVVLAVDDDTANLALLEEVLSSDYDFKPVHTSEKAIILIERFNPSLILLDVNMPNMDGFEILSEIKENPACNNVPVIFITGQDDEHSEIEGFDLGAVDYIMKPFSPASLKARVAHHIKKYAG